MNSRNVAAITDRPLNLPWRGRLARSLFLFVGLTLPATAQLDTQGSGMSDVWQRHFNRDNPGQLFNPENPDHAPHADPDRDGWSNLEESFAGTDPFSGIPPEGLVVSHVTHLKDQEETPTPEYPDGRLIDVAVISWDTLPGKSYTLHYSPDLTNQSWLPVDLPYYGDGQPAATSITLTDTGGISPDRLFWRVAVEDVDNDNDGLTDHEEFLLGSNPYAADTSGDGVPDKWLAIHGLNPSHDHTSILFPQINDGSGTIAEMGILWDSATSSWVDMPSNNSWYNSGLVIFGPDPGLFNVPWNEIHGMNDDGAVVGLSDFGAMSGHAPILQAIMKWDRTGTTQYGSPTYLTATGEFSEYGEGGDPNADVFLWSIPRIADDGTVSAPSWEWVANEYTWVVENPQQGNHSNNMTEWGLFDSGFILGVEAMLDNNTGLAIEAKSDPLNTVLYYRDGGVPEKLEGLLASNGNEVLDTDISLIPATTESQDGRVWFSVNQEVADAVYLEKRAGGNGPSRWHNPPSMAEGAIRLNARGEAITATKVWRNGTYHSLYAALWENVDGEVENLQAIDLASNGLILVQVDIDGVSKTGLLVPVETIDVGTGLSAFSLRASNVAPTVHLDSISLADVTVDGEAGAAVVQVSGTVADCFAGLAVELEIDSINTTTGQSFAVTDGAFSGTVQVPLGSGDARVELETAMNAAGRKGMVSFTLLTDFVPVPPPSIDPSETEEQYDGFAVELDGPLDVAVADTLKVVVRGANRVHLLKIPSAGEIDTVIADVFGKRLSLVEDAVGSLRFAAEDAVLGEVVLQFDSADFTGTDLPSIAQATLSAQHVLGDATLDFRFAAYSEGHSGYQGYRVMALVENAVDSEVFEAVTPDFGTVRFTLEALSGHDPLLIDTMAGNLTWTLPAIGSSLAELAETDLDSGVFVPYSFPNSALGPQRTEDMMMIITGVKNEGVFFGGTETIYKMRVPKLGYTSSHKLITFTDPITSTTQTMDLEEDGETGWYRTNDFAVLDIAPAAAPASEQLLAGLGTQVVWTVQLGDNVELNGETKKMAAKVQPNPSMTESYEWEQGKFFSGPFWLWGDDLIFDKGADGSRDFLKEGDADSEGIIEVKLANSFDRITVEIFPAKTDEKGNLMLENGKPVTDGEILYQASHERKDKVNAGIHRFWDGRVNRIKGGDKAVPNHQAPPLVLPPPPIIEAQDKSKYVVVSYDDATGEVECRKADVDGQNAPQVATFKFNLTQIEQVPANQGVIQAWQTECETATANHTWTQDMMAHAAAHPYFLDPDFGYCLVKVTGEYSEGDIKVPLVVDMPVKAYSKTLIAYVGRDQAFDIIARRTNQLATDIICYERGGLVKPAYIENIYQSGGGVVVTSRHTTQARERETAYPNTVVDLDRDGMTFHDLFKRLTQRGTFAMLTHGTINAIRLENRTAIGFVANNIPTAQQYQQDPYPLPQLGLNTVEVFLQSCHSGTKENGISLATNILDILNTGVPIDGKDNKVTGFVGPFLTKAAPYSYGPKTRPSADKMKPEYFKLNAGLVDEWQKIIQTSGVEAPNPLTYEPDNGDQSIMITELWSAEIAVNVVGTSPIPIGNIRTADYSYELYFPDGNPVQPVTLEIWEIPANTINSTAEGQFVKNFSYTGLDSTTISGVESGKSLVSLTGVTIAGPSIPITAKPDHFFVIRKPGRGGHEYFKRYCLQIEIEQGQMPHSNGTPGGDRMTHLRTQFDDIKVNNIKADDFAMLDCFLDGIKLGEGANAVTEHEH